MKKKRGQAVVEMALCLPLFLAVLLGIIDFGRAFHCWSSLNHQCVEAARMAAKRKYYNIAQNLFTSTSHTDLDKVTAEFWKYQSPLTETSAMVGPTLAGVGTSSDTVTITAGYHFVPWAPGAGLLLGSGPSGSITLTAQVLQRKE